MPLTAPAQLSQVQQVDWLLEQAQALEPREALELAWRAHTLAQFVGYTAGVALSLQWVARLELELGQLEPAREHLRAAFELSQHIRNQRAFDACLQTAQRLLEHLAQRPTSALPAAA